MKPTCYVRTKEGSTPLSEGQCPHWAGTGKFSHGDNSKQTSRGDSEAPGRVDVGDGK